MGSGEELFDTEIEFSDIENYIEDMKLWAVPFNSLGNSSDVLFAFLADGDRIYRKKIKQ